MTEEITRLFENVVIEEPSVEVTEADESHGTLTVGPLMKGYGITLGNSLRRVMLSSLPGTAVTKIVLSVNGVQALHELSSLDGLKEDVTEIVLNVKGIIGKLYSKEPLTVCIDRDTSGEVTAGDIKTSSELVIVNPEHHIATLSEKSRLHMELTFSNGVGYVSADKNKEAFGGPQVGVIFTDSIYTPVHAVSYSVDSVRVGSVIDYDRLNLQVTTNGSITPRDAVAVSSQILREHYKMLTALGGAEDSPSLMVPNSDTARQAVLDTAIEELDFTVRSFNCLKRAGISTVGDITEKTLDEVTKIRNLGKKSLEEIEQKIKSLGLSFREEEV